MYQIASPVDDNTASFGNTLLTFDQRKSPYVDLAIRSRSRYPFNIHVINQHIKSKHIQLTINKKALPRWSHRSYTPSFTDCSSNSGASEMGSRCFWIGSKLENQFGSINSGNDNRSPLPLFLTRCGVDLYRPCVHTSNMSPRLTTNESGTGGASIHSPVRVRTCKPPELSCNSTVKKP